MLGAAAAPAGPARPHHPPTLVPPSPPVRLKPTAAVHRVALIHTELHVHLKKYISSKALNEVNGNKISVRKNVLLRQSFKVFVLVLKLLIYLGFCFDTYLEADNTSVAEFESLKGSLEVS